MMIVQARQQRPAAPVDVTAARQPLPDLYDVPAVNPYVDEPAPLDLDVLDQHRSATRARVAAQEAIDTDIRSPPPWASERAAAPAAKMPVTGSAIASPRKTGAPFPSTPVSPPATAASSPKAMRSSSRPYPVMLTQTRPGRGARKRSANTPSRRSARGRDASTTTSASAMISVSAPEAKSTTRLSCPSCNQR